MAVLPAALCWGAGFPFALAAVARGSDAGPATAAVYAANTVGAILGALGFSMLVFPWFGPQPAQQLLVAIAAAISLLMLAGLLRVRPRTAPDRPGYAASPTIPVFAVAAGAVIVALLIASVPDVPVKPTGICGSNI